MVNDQLPLEEYYTWRGWQLGPGGRKEVPPYYAQNNYSSILQQGPTGRATLFREKYVSPLTAGTHRTGQRISQKQRSPAVSSDPPEVPPYYAQKNEYSPG